LFTQPTPDGGNFPCRGWKHRTPGKSAVPPHFTQFARHVVISSHHSGQNQGEIGFMNKPVAIGFIGAGEISLLHAKAIQSIPEARLVGLWNLEPDKAVERAQFYQCRR
jgi:hypothetical protein